ncbi:MAG: hypothetical protein EON88_10100 [Brevundimonas sp.]|uniref:hypothetical protein n=1 Tax=Brevundimonas sp. Leaf363 TaxID=1736353 RepID=UPI0006F7C7E9|nr:hypothetical protein [Brevundimonas sp. Leaf363]KQS57735.1 hypothetical protein ASG17_01155 [Brevundimonas sp. Leaf363]RZJ95693.1 MAG: hypothetical protein EON88_10100 [Brevundimonas sp.]
MHRLLTFRRLSILFLGLFALAIGGVLLLQQFYIAPGERCEASGKWWDPDSQTCAQPISIAEITGRPIGQSREEASNDFNRELIAIEDRLAAEKRAQDAATQAERDRVNALRPGL